MNSLGEFILTQPNMTVRPRGDIYSLNEGYASYWSPAIREYIHSKKFPAVSSHLFVLLHPALV
ncbi:unnamed protein product [Protopolystoma xenopodis]|uniref:Fructose-1-6-bisphosphatase class 1 C-terminal domain-containing protein n=1 Tax=Protopolystoma xenopodis TaxID=117903 RepID=A0A3S5AMI4_9PLAT|nr:unnamed protein product [Protopolystoma xenopodis]